jgi:hypothetical protein
MPNRSGHMRLAPALAIIAILAAAVAPRASAQAAARRTTGAHTMTTPFHTPSDSELKQTLTPLQYQVTQHEGTVRPFQYEFWVNHEAGI